MALVNGGRDCLADAIIGGTGHTKFNNANAYIGVGDSSTAYAATQTDLQAATNKLRKGMDTSYPTRTNNAVNFRATVGTASGNFAWNEWGIFNAAAAGTMLSRKVEALGTKTSAQSWQFTATLTITVGV